MKLTQLAAKPQLVRIELDDEEIRKEYNDSLEFWVWDRQPLEHFVKLVTTETNELGKMITLVNEMILDENGEKVMQDGFALPSNIVLKVINAVTEKLGK